MARKNGSENPPRELSHKNARNRLRRAINPEKIKRDVEMIKPIEEWDWEELQRGYPRGPSGQFGKAPLWANVIATEDEIQRRMRRMAHSKLRGYAGVAMDTMVELLTDDSVDLDGKPSVPASVRLKAAEYILDQTIGKATAHVEVEAGNSLKDFLAECMVNDDGEDAHPVVIPGEVEADKETEDL